MQIDKWCLNKIDQPKDETCSAAQATMRDIGYYCGRHSQQIVNLHRAEWGDWVLHGFAIDKVEVNRTREYSRLSVSSERSTNGDIWLHWRHRCASKVLSLKIEMRHRDACQDLFVAWTILFVDDNCLVTTQTRVNARDKVSSLITCY